MITARQTAIAFYDWCAINGYHNNVRKLTPTTEIRQYFTTPEIWNRFEGFMGTSEWGWYITNNDKKFLKDTRYE